MMNSKIWQAYVQAGFDPSKDENIWAWSSASPYAGQWNESSLVSLTDNFCDRPPPTKISPHYAGKPLKVLSHIFFDSSTLVYLYDDQTFQTHDGRHSYTLALMRLASDQATDLILSLQTPLLRSWIILVWLWSDFLPDFTLGWRNKKLRKWSRKTKICSISPTVFVCSASHV